jgi:hypothetical protein
MMRVRGLGHHHFSQLIDEGAVYTEPFFFNFFNLDFACLGSLTKIRITDFSKKRKKLKKKKFRV